MRKREKANIDLRQAMDDAGVRQWEVADMYGLGEQNFSRLMRKELPQEVKDKIFSIIDELKVSNGYIGA